jgi:hypothetical protein
MPAVFRMDFRVHPVASPKAAATRSWQATYAA